MPGLHSARVPGGVRLYRPGLGAAILLRGFHPGRWERIAAKSEGLYGSLLRAPDWTSVEKATYEAQTTQQFGTLSSLLRRIRATAGAGPVNSTDVWTSCRGLRLETDDGRAALPRPHPAPDTEALRTGVGGHPQDMHLPM
ncbi:hypothetical protein N7925_35665 [Streptomyces sp. CA-278952]|uniref:hypothetical protein n=1 Tax=Streptomyces sp. CA-278952 TaxID=2980556 RepID=UPI00236773B7|nr:hypothetical protein [Streptomyces sp. CA-278952]WDG33290.1 hypothetical protein N7925_35665 [Streptomyces sp. CA-278952]